MTENPADYIPIWMLFSAILGFVVGEFCGDNSRHRKCVQQANEELRDRLQEATTATEPIQLRHQRTTRRGSTTSTAGFWLFQKPSKTSRLNPMKSMAGSD
jgi:hypothetical protein